MTDIKVHSIPGSPYGRAVLIALEEKHATYQLFPVQPKTLRSPEHLARHPFGRIPVLEHGDFRLYETQAILRYIDRTLPGPLLTPLDPRAAARMDQLMNVNDWYLFQGVGNVIGFQRVVAPKLLGLAPDEAAIVAAMPKAHVVFDALARELGDGRYAARFLYRHSGMVRAHGEKSRSGALDGSDARSSEHASDGLGARGGDGSGELRRRGQERSRVRMLRRAEHAFRGTLLDDASLLHDVDPVRNRPHHVKIVRDE